MIEYRLKPEESLRVKKALGSAYRSIRNAIRTIGIESSSSHFANILSGKRSLSPIIAYQIHRALGFDESLDFLCDAYNNLLKQLQLTITQDSQGLEGVVSDPLDKAWIDLFNAHVNALGSTYVTRPPGEKGEIIDGIKKLNERYGAKS